jgi:hypothetical protein
MSNTMTLSELASAIEGRDAIKKDYIVSPRDLVAEVRYGDDHHRVPLMDTEEPATAMVRAETVRPDHTNEEPLMTIPSAVAVDQLSSWSPVGQRYGRHMIDHAPELWAENMNHWFCEGPENNRMLRTIPVNGHSTMRAFVSDKFGRFEDAHLLRPVLERAADKGWKIDHTALTDRRMHVRVLFPKMLGDVKLNDPVQAGVAFTNSEVGFSQWKAEFFILRLVCLNGMVSKQFVAGFSRRHITARQNMGWLTPSTLALEDRLLQSHVGDTLEAMSDTAKFDRVLAVMRESTNAMPQNIIGASIELGRVAGLSGAEVATVQENWVEEGDRSLWGLVNALTRTARDTPSFERRAEMESAAGAVIENPRSWRRIIEAQPQKARVA